MIPQNMIMQLMSKFRGVSNPQEMAMSMLQGQFKNANIDQNIADNVMGMCNNNDFSGLENFARKMGKEKGIDVDQLFNQIKNGMGM